MSKKPCDGSCAEKAVKKNSRPKKAPVKSGPVNEPIKEDPGENPVGTVNDQIVISVEEKDSNENPARLLGQAVKKARKDINLTKKELGRLAGVSKKQISRLEKNALKTKLDTIIKVNKALSLNLHVSLEAPDQTIALT